MDLVELHKKIEHLETRQAFQEDTIETLDNVIIQLQKDIERLGLKISILEERIKQTANTPTEIAAEDPPPPHY